MGIQMYYISGTIIFDMLPILKVSINIIYFNNLPYLLYDSGNHCLLVMPWSYHCFCTEVIAS